MMVPIFLRATSMIRSIYRSVKSFGQTHDESTQTSVSFINNSVVRQFSLVLVETPLNFTAVMPHILFFHFRFDMKATFASI